MGRAKITGHAVSRYRKRVDALSYDEVVAQLDTPAVRLAIEIGACGVRLPSGHRAVIVNGAVVTIHPKVAYQKTGKFVRGRRPHCFDEGEVE